MELFSKSPFETPRICFHSFDEGNVKEWYKDVDALVEAIESMRRIDGARHTLFGKEIQPAGYLEKINERRRGENKRPWTLKDWIMAEAWGHHACGTCRIGSDRWRSDPKDLKDANAVLDSRFRVHGVKGLRIVDASVFPKIPGYFILAPVFMVSEKAAITILEDEARQGVSAENRARWCEDHAEDDDHASVASGEPSAQNQPKLVVAESREEREPSPVLPQPPAENRSEASEAGPAESNFPPRTTNNHGTKMTLTTNRLIRPTSTIRKRCATEALKALCKRAARSPICRGNWTTSPAWLFPAVEFAALFSILACCKAWRKKTNFAASITCRRSRAAVLSGDFWAAFTCATGSPNRSIHAAASKT